jgi:hypothetical protein
MTRYLNTVTSRLAFHGMRVVGSTTFVQQIEYCIQAISDRMETENNDISTVRRDYVTAATVVLRERLTHLKTEHHTLTFEISLKQKIAQSQREIVGLLFFDWKHEINYF